MNNETARAYAEVLQILEHLPKEDYDKIPGPIINKMLQNYDETYNFEYNLAEPYEKQAVSLEARQILAEFQRRFWKD